MPTPDELRASREGSAPRQDTVCLPGVAPTRSTLEKSLHALGSENLFVDFEAATRGGFFVAGEQYWFGHPQSELMVPSAQYRAAFYLGYSEPMDAVFW